MTLASTLPQTLTRDVASGSLHGLRHVLGNAAWLRLPEAVRERFADDVECATYAGSFEIVRASVLGQVFARVGTLFGTPVAPRAGCNVEARVHVHRDRGGMAWDREYRWPEGGRHLVRSTKCVDRGQLVEKLPARMCMPLRAYEEAGVLHFVSRGYYFDLGIRVWLPPVFSPGITHVEHIDLGHGWFRFTMSVTHPLFGETFFQTGRFCATEDLP